MESKVIIYHFSEGWGVRIYTKGELPKHQMSPTLLEACVFAESYA